MVGSAGLSFGAKLSFWILRFVKFNLVGGLVFLVATLVYVVSFSLFGFWTWLLANACGSLLQFSLIAYLNTKEKGRMFDSCPSKHS